MYPLPQVLYISNETNNMLKQNVNISLSIPLKASPVWPAHRLKLKIKLFSYWPLKSRTENVTCLKPMIIGMNCMGFTMWKRSREAAFPCFFFIAKEKEPKELKFTYKQMHRPVSEWSFYASISAPFKVNLAVYDHDRSWNFGTGFIFHSKKERRRTLTH